MIADLHVYELGDTILLTLHRDVKDAVLAKLDQFIFTEDVQLGDVTETFVQLAVVGPDAARIVASVVQVPPEGLRALPEHGNVRTAFGPTLDGGPAIVTRNYRQLGIALPLYQSHGVASKQFVELAGAAADGVRLPAAALLVADKLPDSDPQKQVVVGYTRAYQQKTGQPVSTFGGHAYDGLMIFVEAAKRAGSFDKAKVRDEIEKTKNFIGTGGIVNMSPSDHLGLDLSAFRMLEIKGGDWTLAQ